MAFGGEIDDGARAVLGQQLAYQRPVADIAFDEAVTPVSGQVGQGQRIAGISQLIEVQHRFLFRSHPVADEVGTDKAGAAGDENHGFSDLGAPKGAQAAILPASSRQAPKQAADREILRSFNLKTGCFGCFQALI